MTRRTRTKICGLSTPETAAAAVEAGAAFVGFVFFDKSPRNVSVEQAMALALAIPPGVVKVALTVNASDALLTKLTESVALDMLQLHGNESLERVADVQARFRLPVMKALGVADESDLLAVEAYAAVADQILIDAKPPKNSVLPGGNGLAFDWRLMAGRRFACPWMLAGGLTPENVAEAISLTGARQVDVSSGVESSPGVKDIAAISAFIEAAG
ncbi:phosphoribosylanthranilate isomerase [uncultured Boseongicola sp.]|jgi:phosphoribosylanthranilate isomerase|uniref:phosphoribosylanthranilate isomerase n=1 Tax=uncultured Boseongicola sp. TaxID=1648499 RepID=UPI0026072090|nr:phosphoribosylanthranilate isomerase [uncultured Boseongicola sp.]